MYVRVRDVSFVICRNMNGIFRFKREGVPKTFVRRFSTIFGLASGAGRAGVSVFRLSGPEVGSAWRALTGRSALPAARVATLAWLRGRDGALLDRCLALHFEAPRSFSGESTLELHVHGSPAVRRALAEELAALPGVRTALPGEFTRRAFLNGRLSLAEAEGLADLVQAQTRAQRVQALRQMGGELGRVCGEWRARAVGLLARAEAVVDFGEEERVDTGGEVARGLVPEARELSREMRKRLESDGNRGERVR